MNILTLIGGEVLQVDQHGEVIARLGRDDVRPIFPVEHLLGTIAHEILVTPDLNGYLDLGFDFGGRDVEDDAVKVGHGLINRHGRCSVRGEGGFC